MSTSGHSLARMIERTAAYATRLREQAFGVILRIGPSGSSVFVRGVASGINMTSRAQPGGLFEDADPIVRWPKTGSGVPTVALDTDDAAPLYLLSMDGNGFSVAVLEGTTGDTLSVAVVGGAITIRLAAGGSTAVQVSTAIANSASNVLAIISGDPSDLVAATATVHSTVPTVPAPELGTFVRVYDRTLLTPRSPWHTIAERGEHPTNPEWRARLASLDRETSA